MENQIETIKFTPEKAKQTALARLDLIHKWLEFRRKVNNKIQADYDFVKLHNTTEYCHVHDSIIMWKYNNRGSSCQDQILNNLIIFILKLPK